MKTLPLLGLALALVSLWLGLMWIAAMRPLTAPDEPAYLQTVMEVRKGHLLPEVHFDLNSSYNGQVVGSPGDADVRNYTLSAGVSDPPLRLIPYQTVQPPLAQVVRVVRQGRRVQDDRIGVGLLQRADQLRGIIALPALDVAP